MLYINNKSLQQIYDEYLEKYKTTGIRPYPDSLLGILLFQEKEKYKSIEGIQRNFYEFYKKEIDEKIEKVINDFNISEEDIKEYAVEKVSSIYGIDYETIKIWNVFVGGFAALNWVLEFYPNYTPERAYYRAHGIFYKGVSRKENTKFRKRTLERYKRKYIK